MSAARPAEALPCIGQARMYPDPPRREKDLCRSSSSATRLPTNLSDSEVFLPPRRDQDDSRFQRLTRRSLVAASEAVLLRPTHARYGVLGFTLVLSAIAYLDRVWISTGRPLRLTCV